MKTIYLDGQFLRVDDQIIKAFAPGAFKACGVFETILVLDGVILDLAEHVKRLRQGLKVLSIALPSIDLSLLKELLRSNKLSSARLRLMVWKAGQAIHVMAIATPYTMNKKKTFRVCLVKTKRMANARFAHVKSLDYGLFAEAFQQAQHQGYDEALLINSRGHIFEASRANIFWMKDKVLYTPPLSSGCLNGITRQQVIHQALNIKISVKEKNLTPEILRAADAAFLTNSLIGIKPITLAQN